MVSVNRLAYKLARRLVEESGYFRVKVETVDGGATVIDTGIEAVGGYEAGLMITKIAMGGLCDVFISMLDYGGIVLPTINVYTDHPAVSLLGCQLAGWNVKTEDFRAMASGPGRALALKPKKVYEKIGYRDDADVAVLLLETEKYPTRSAVELISEKCGVKPENLYLVLTTTRSIAGSTQVSGRIVETGLYRLDYLGFDPKLVVSGVGYAPIMPIHPDEGVTLGREEDALIYGGSTSFIVDYEDDHALKDLIARAPATTSNFYGKPSYQVLKSVEFDWSKLDPAFFAPGMLRLENLKTGVVHQAGRINIDVLKESLGIA